MSSQNAWAMSEGFGSRNVWTSNSVVRPCQSPMPTRKTAIAGTQSRSRVPISRVKPDGIGSTTVLLRRAPPPRRSGRRSVAVAGRERLAHRGDELEEPGVLARLAAAGLRQVDVDRRGDPARPRGHHDDARREEHRLGDRVRHEDDRRARLLPDAQELHVDPLAGHLVEGAERLVHEQQRRVERECACDRDALLHAARELPRAARLEAGQLDELEHLPDALLPLRPVPAEQLEGERDVPLHGAPVVEHGVLEDDPVVVVDARLVRGLAVDAQAPRRRLHEVADDPQQRRLPASRRPDQRDELARRDLEVDVLQRGDARAEGLREPLDRDDALGRAGHAKFSGARRRISRSASATAPNSTRPSTAQTMFVAQRNVGWSE